MIKLLKILILLTITINISLSAYSQMVHSGVWTGSGTAYSADAGCNTITTSVVNYSGATTIFNNNDFLGCTAASFSEPVLNTPSLTILFDWASAGSGNGYGDITFNFAIPTDNPVLHIEKIGGLDGAQSNTAKFTITTPGLTLTELAEIDTHFETTINTIKRTPNVATTFGNCGQANCCAAGGSVQINGTNITSVTFRWVREGPIGMGDEIEFVWSLNDFIIDVDDINDVTVCNSFNLPGITGSNLSGNENYYSAPNGGGTIVTSPITTSQTIYIYDSNGACSDEESFIVTVDNQLIINATSDSICVGETASLLASGANTYVWSTSSTNNPLLISPTITTTYSVTGTDANGCVGTTTANVIVAEKPILNISGVDEICNKSNGSATVTASGGSSGTYTYAWNTIPITTTPNITNIPSGTYTVTVEDNGCYETASVNIANIPGPTATYYVSPKVAEKNEIIQFTDVSIGAISWFWDFADGNTASGLDPTHNYNTSGVFDTWLYVEDDKECIDSTSVRIIIRQLFTFYIPNSFSPNGDNINDIFLPKGINIDKDRFLMHIYDRWGKKVFETTNLYEGWDGKINGQAIKNYDMMGAIFVYYIYLYEKDTNISHEYRGKVLLLK